MWSQPIILYVDDTVNISEHLVYRIFRLLDIFGLYIIVMEYIDIFALKIRCKVSPYQSIMMRFLM